MEIRVSILIDGCRSYIFLEVLFFLIDVQIAKEVSKENGCW